MTDLQIVTPARARHIRDASGNLAWVRKASIAQAFDSETIAVIGPDGACLAVGYLRPGRGRCMHFALAIRRDAAPHMRLLIRFAHLTLDRIAQTGTVVVTEIHPENRQGQRMARLAGFRRWRLGTAKSIWIWRHHGKPFRRR